jgi:hypothetical protein
MNIENIGFWLVIILPVIVPIIVWYLLRRKKHLPHIILSFIALCVYNLTFIVMILAYDSLFSKDCSNDCQNGIGLAIAIYSIPGFVFYSTIFLAFLVSWVLMNIYRNLKK